MTRSFKLGAIAAAAFIAAPAFAAASLDANLELDTDFYSKNDNRMQQGGRVEINVSGKKEIGGAYVASRASVLAKKDGTAGVDDMWVEGGTSAVAVRLGRFEAADLFPMGKDTLVVGGDKYATADARGRKGAADPHVAVMAKLGANANFELGLIEVSDGTGVNADKNRIGVRPVIGFGAGPLTIKLGAEKIDGAGDTGFGATVGGTVSGVGFNVNFAKKGDATGFGLNATMGAFGIGYVAGDNGAATANKSRSIYAAYSVPFFVDGATATFAVSNGKTYGGQADTGFRLRVNYGF